MTTLRKTQIIAALVACATWVIPLHQLQAAPPVGAAAPTVNDVAMDADGLLHGYLFDSQVQPMAGQRIVILQSAQPIAEATTDTQGKFSVPGLRGGLYEVAVGEHVSVWRVWAPLTAPPVAKPQLILTDGGDVERAKRRAVDLFHPILIGLIIAAAIAIPIALSRDRDDAS